MAVAVTEQPSGTVTFLFTDIEGSTRLLAEIGRDPYAAVLERHRHLLRLAFGRHGGYEVDCEGDSFFVSFSGATDAVAAAEEAQAALGGEPVRVRMGLHTGEPLLAPPKYVGLDVHKAARIAAAAHGGQVLVSQATRDLVEADFHDLGLHRLKDLRDPVRLFQLGQAHFPPPRSLNPTHLPAPPRPARARGEVLGREDQLAALAAFIDAAAPPALLVVEGVAGMGKTTLWREGVALARDRGMTVLACRPGAAETGFSYAALGDLLAGVLDDVLIELPPPLRRALEAALVLGDAEGSPPEERVIALALLSLLRRLATEQSLLVAIDDAQWLDRPSASVLEFAARRLSDERVLLMLSARRDRGEPTLRLERALEERTRRLAVGPLSRSALHRLVVSRLGEALPRPALLRAHEISGGNPFYALEIARTLLDRGGDLEAGVEVPLPATVEELVHGRLDELPGEVRRLLEPVALLAEPTVALVRQVAPDPERVEEWLDQAEEAGVIELDRGRIRFAHPLLAASAAATMGSQRRRLLHQRLADAIGEPEQRARHLALATTQPDAEVADAVEAGGRAAAGRGAPEAAAELTDLAFSLTPADQPADVDRRRRQAATHHLDAGNAERARSLLEDGLETALPGLQRARLLWQLGLVRGEQESTRIAIDFYERALAEAEGDPALAVILETGLAWMLMTSQSVAAADVHAVAATESAERLGDPALVAEALATLAHVKFLLGGGVQTELLERAIECERLCGQLWLDLRPSTILALQLLYADALDEARVELERLREDAFERGEAGVQVPICYLAFVEERAGRWQEMTATAADGYEVALQTGRKVNEPAALASLAAAAAYLGRVDEARARAYEALQIAERSEQPWFVIHARSALGSLELALGDPAGAHDCLEPAIDAIGRLGIREPGVFPCMADEIEALIALRELEQAGALLDRYESEAAAVRRWSAIAAAARCRGLLLLANNDVDAATEQMESALSAHERLPTPQPFERARATLALGVAQRQTRPEKARETLVSARAAFDELGAQLWATKVQAELDSLGAQRASPA